MMRYYAHLSKEVSILGSDEAETFQVLSGEDGRVLVSVAGEGGNGMYERVFDPKYTKEIRLYGLEGNDHFQIEGQKSPIKIRVIGGPGQDQFVNNAHQKKLYVYDVDVEGNTVSGNHPETGTFTLPAGTHTLLVEDFGEDAAGATVSIVITRE